MLDNFQNLVMNQDLNVTKLFRQSVIQSLPCVPSTLTQQLPTIPSAAIYLVRRDSLNAGPSHDLLQRMRNDKNVGIKLTRLVLYCLMQVSKEFGVLKQFSISHAAVRCGTRPCALDCALKARSHALGNVDARVFISAAGLMRLSHALNATVDATVQKMERRSKAYLSLRFCIHTARLRALSTNSTLQHAAAALRPQALFASEPGHW